MSKGYQFLLTHIRFANDGEQILRLKSVKHTQDLIRVRS